MKTVCVGVLAVMCFCVLMIVNGTSAESENFMEMLRSTNFKTRVDALKIIERSVVDQPEVFVFIKDELAKRDSFDSRNPNTIDELSWMCKALVSSGDSQYLTTVDNVISKTSNTKLIRHCTRAKDQFDIYVKNRKILSQPQIDGFSEEMSKNIHMLNSREVRLMRYAVNNISSSVDSSEVVYDMVRDVMLEEVGVLGNKYQPVCPASIHSHIFVNA